MSLIITRGYGNNVVISADLDIEIDSNQLTVDISTNEIDVEVCCCD